VGRPERGSSSHEAQHQLSQELGHNGAKVTYHTWAGATHGGVLTAAAKDATAFVRKHLGKG
jgi:hypothetical protein